MSFAIDSNMECVSLETVLKLIMERAFSPFACCDSFPGALPQAGIERAFGAYGPDFKALGAPKARTIPEA
jgi:hypothetical protein